MNEKTFAKIDAKKMNEALAAANAAGVFHIRFSSNQSTLFMNVRLRDNLLSLPIGTISQQYAYSQGIVIPELYNELILPPDSHPTILAKNNERQLEIRINHHIPPITFGVVDSYANVQYVEMQFTASTANLVHQRLIANATASKLRRNGSQAFLLFIDHERQRVKTWTYGQTIVFESEVRCNPKDVDNPHPYPYGPFYVSTHDYEQLNENTNAKPVTLRVHPKGTFVEIETQNQRILTAKKINPENYLYPTPQEFHNTVRIIKPQPTLFPITTIPPKRNLKPITTPINLSIAKNEWNIVQKISKILHAPIPTVQYALVAHPHCHENVQTVLFSFTLNDSAFVATYQQSTS